MKFFGFFSMLILLAACSDSSAVGKKLSGSDSLVIQFNTPQTNTIAKTVSTTETKAIKKLILFVDAKTSEVYKCGYDGNLMFYKKGVLSGDIAFNYLGAGCQHFIIEIDGKMVPTQMSNEAVDFLKSLSEGKNWY